MEIKDPNGPMLYCAFNVQATRLCVGTRIGFMIFQAEPFQRLYRSDTGGCSVVQVLDDKPLVATVGSGEYVTCSRRVVKLYSLSPQAQEICKLPFETPVLNVRITAQRLVVVTESEIHIYDTQKLHFIEKLSTSPNPKGLCALGFIQGRSEHATMMLAYPCPRGEQQGNLFLYDPIARVTQKLEGIHSHPLAHVQFSPDGMYVATASEEGTLIKITPTKPDSTEPPCIFRRGMISRADITSIAFDNEVTFLAVSSTHGTTHIFDIIREQTKHTQAPSTLGYLAGWVVGEETRSFCTFSVPQGTQNISIFSKDLKRIFNVTQDGKWQIPEIPATGWTYSMTYPTCTQKRVDDLLEDYTYCDDDIDTLEAR